MSRPMIRCAVYTRKSSDEGLDQDFNSLDAQHEACAAYIASQRHEGWKMLPARYDDGGISGGTLDRPGLQRLMADIDAGRIDMVVVYKIDRLTRSLSDFAKLVERLEAANCSFVSVTQAFNTSSSMGRLTLNVLLSFAQFEREVTAERIRDKIAASKKKGLWMGGVPPLGYDPHPDPTRRELAVNAEEAEIVRQVFALYETHGCLNATARAAEQLGLRSKRHVFSSGRTQGGLPFSRGQIHKLLTNPVYRGLIRHKDKTWPGLHDAIVDQDVWDRVQAKLQDASARRRGSKASSQITIANAAPLLGKVKDETGDLLTPSHTQRHGRRLRYYVSNRLISGGRDPDAWRLPAPALEEAVCRIVASHLREHAIRHSVAQSAEASASRAISERTQVLADGIRSGGIQRAIPLVESILIARGQIQVRLDGTALASALDLTPAALDPSLLSISAPFTCRRRGIETKIIAGDRVPQPDPTLLRALRTAYLWAATMRSGTPLKKIASDAGVTERYAARIIPLACLSPGLQQAIVDGTQPARLTLERLIRKKLPLDWDAQERMLRIDG
ncbi:recombinase family protein [Roseibacterium sp. SDUM158017]|uniref:recombinase family protein n=1 Tax=Roseicyclus salinarum TaxID=3036773 RepID=UPI0024158690|nr:recombinase family protein [Roseibacterium sp. SDUM158017]MDG4649351.1 recombinase family protein [Roseibacterium sp. SDUM158017]